MRILVIHGPNLNLLGRREPSVYGSATLHEIDAAIREWAAARGVTVRIEQTNHEGAMIDLLHQSVGWADGVVINPGAYAHTSLAVADAIRAIGLPCVEVHLTNIFAREQVRRRSVVAEACLGVIAGLGAHGYVAACVALLDRAASAQVRPEPNPPPRAP